MRTSRAALAAAGAVTLIGLSPAPAVAAEAGYTLAVLPTLGGFTTAYAVSPNGQYVTGYSEQNSVSRAFRWSAAGTQWLAQPEGTGHSDAFAVGNDGTVVGWASGCLPSCVSYAVRWRVGASPEVLGSGAAHALSPDGTLVGGGAALATLWTAAGERPKAERGALWAVANDGSAAGTAHASDGGDRPAFWPPSGPAQLLPMPSGVTSGFAHAMSGTTVVGTTGNRMAVWVNGALAQVQPTTPPGARGRPATSSARDLNSAGVIVGDANDRAARWTGGGYTDLNSFLPRKSSVTLVRAYGISEGGRIVGWARSGSGSVAFVLTPRSA